MKGHMRAVCAALVIFLSAICSRAVPGSPLPSDGCCLSGTAAAGGIPGIPVVGSVFAPQFERALLTDESELERLFGYHPHIFYLRESDATGANAFSSPHVYPDLLHQEGTNEYQFPDGTIFLGERLLEMENASTQGQNFSVPAILAHEYGHVVQEKNNCPLIGKWRELDADYIAGWFIAHKRRFVAQDINQPMMSLFAKGDYDFVSPGHHGTPEERRAAFLAGFNFNCISNSPSGPLAYMSSLNYIHSLMR